MTEQRTVVEEPCGVKNGRTKASSSEELVSPYFHVCNAMPKGIVQTGKLPNGGVARAYMLEAIPTPTSTLFHPEVCRASVGESRTSVGVDQQFVARSSLATDSKRKGDRESDFVHRCTPTSQGIQRDSMDEDYRTEDHTTKNADHDSNASQKHAYFRLRTCNEGQSSSRQSRTCGTGGRELDPAKAGARRSSSLLEL